MHGVGHLVFLDWYQIAEFAVGLETPADSCQFAAADCAPRATLGDGLITTTDTVQALRYFVGLDPVQAVGGPTNIIVIPQLPGIGPRTVFIDGGNLVRGQSGIVTLYLDAAGDESAVGCTLTFDPTLLQYEGTSNSPQYTVIVNANQAADGLLGLLANSAGSFAFAAGNQPLAIISFAAIPGTNTTTTLIGFTNSPVLCEVASTNADPLESPFSGISLIVTAMPFFSNPAWTSQGFSATVSGDAGSVYTVESSTNLASWIPIVTLTNTAGSTPFVDGAALSNTTRFYRAVLVP